VNELPREFPLRLVFLSDWHVGTGQGRLAAVDAEVRRDRDGMPFVPAKTLAGVLRDACETVAAVLDRSALDRSATATDGATGDGAGSRRWQAWVDWVFGSQPASSGDAVREHRDPPIPAALTLTPARAPEGLLAAVRDRPLLAEAALILRPGVRIDPATGTAVKDFLRVEERARRGAVLHATASLDIAARTCPAPAELLLRAGARLVDALGGKRNRGSGRVVVALPGVPAPDGAGGAPVRADEDAPPDPRLVELLGRPGLIADPGVPPRSPEVFRPYVVGRVADATRQVLRVVFRVRTPVVAADGVLGNLITSRAYVPGTTLLGAVLGRVSRSGGIGLGDVRVGDAVPAVPSSGSPAGVAPAWAGPMVWLGTEKGAGPDVVNSAVQPPPARAQAKPIDGWVARAGAGTWQKHTPSFAVSTHAVIDDAARRPTTSGGGVYTYLGIAPGTLLVSDIVLPADASLDLAPGATLRLGRSRKDDFGRVEVLSITPMSAGLSDHRAAAGGGFPQLVRVWCVSDVLLRDERWSPDPTPQRLAVVLGEALGAQLVAVAAGTGQTTPTRVDASRADGFVRSWGRPRPSQVGLRAGSVVTMSVAAGRIDPERAARVERDGIGERTAEGFGRVLLNPPELDVARPAVLTEAVLTAEAAGRDSAASAAESAGAVGGADGEQPWRPPETPHPLELAAWRRAVRRAAAARALDPEAVIPGITSGPSPAQLGALRGQLERLRLPRGEEMARHWFAATAAVARRKTAWGKALPAAQKLLLDADAVWQQLGLDGAQPGLVLASGREGMVRAALRVEAVTVLVTEVVRAARAAAGGNGQGADLAARAAREETR
jgi:CRISPR-associated protein Csx10